MAEKVVVITGESSGIGEATARRLDREGARLVMVPTATANYASTKAALNMLSRIARADLSPRRRSSLPTR